MSFPGVKSAMSLQSGTAGCGSCSAITAAFRVFCFGGSLIGMITGGVRAKKARDGIRAARAHATSQGPDSQPVTSSFDIQWKVALAILAATAALSVVGWLLAPHHVLM
jgi:hypothetical protein